MSASPGVNHRMIDTVLPTVEVLAAKGDSANEAAAG